MTGSRGDSHVTFQRSPRTQRCASSRSAPPRAPRPPDPPRLNVRDSERRCPQNRNCHRADLAACRVTNGPRSLLSGATSPQRSRRDEIFGPESARTETAAKGRGSRRSQRPRITRITRITRKRTQSRNREDGRRTVIVPLESTGEAASTKSSKQKKKQSLRRLDLGARRRFAVGCWA